MEIRKITIIGMGLIGGSLGMALKRTNPQLQVCGVDIQETTIKAAIETKSIDWGTSEAVEAVKDADVVFLATFITDIPRIAQEIAPHLKSGAIVTDVGSTKKIVVEKVIDVLPEAVYYIGGHPMAGSESKGIVGADSYLFENAAYILTPIESTNKQALVKIRELIQGIGARVLELSPQEHDYMVAAISHLPHIVAAALVNTIGEVEESQQGRIFQLAAGGFRDVTRITDSQPLMWKEIFLQNKDSVLGLIKLFRESLDQLEAAISEENSQKILQNMTNAKRLRQQIPAKTKGLLPQIYEIVVTAPDEPGIIGKIAQVLGKASINIIDIEILRVREGDGGTIRLGFQKEEMVASAIQIMRENGFIAKART